MNRSLLRRSLATLLFLGRRRAERRRSWDPPDSLRHTQDRRVRRLVRHAYLTVPYYRDAMRERGLVPEDFTTAADLARLPLVTGDELATTPLRFRSSSFPPGSVLEVSSTGTSGRLKVIAHDDRALLAAFAAGQRLQRVIRGMVGTRGALHTVFVAPPEGTWKALEAWFAAVTLQPFRHRSQRTFVPVDTPVEQVVAILNQVRPEVVNGFGSAVGFVYRWAIHHGREVWLPRLVVTGGDHLPAPDRQLIEDRLGVPTLSIYQACEALMIAVQCERREGFHISSDLVHLRTVDSRGDEVPTEQEGSLVLSNLVNRATVLLNYQLGDRGTLASAPCRCGRSFPLLLCLQGRADDLLVRNDGQRVHEGLVLKGLHAVPGVLEVAVVQHTETEVEVKLVTVPGHSPDDVANAVSLALHGLLGDDPTVRVTVIPVDSIPSVAGGKRRMVVSKCTRVP